MISQAKQLLIRLHVALRSNPYRPPRTRTVYASDAGNSLALLDAVLQIERTNKK